MARVERARAALRRARLEAPRRAPAELARAVEAATALEMALARSRASPFASPSARQVARLAGRAEAAASAAVDRARAHAAREEEAIAGGRGALEARLGRVGDALAQTPADRALRTAYRRSRIEIAVVAAAPRDGDLLTASRALVTASGAVADAEAALDRHQERLADPRLRRRWQTWVDQTLAAAGAGEAVVVDKLARRCYLLRGGRVAAAFPAELGRNGLADKLYAGDAATPEWRYRVVDKREGEATHYYRALMLDYPTAEDRRTFDDARRRGLIPRGRAIGGAIEIHGHGGRAIDWTSGCVALRNEHMDRLYAGVAVGTPVTIVGTARLPMPAREKARAKDLPAAAGIKEKPPR